MSAIALNPPVPSDNSTTQASSSSVVSSTSASSDQDMFLQLLVAELQNQDPTNPVQGTDFVTQLAEFQQLEQSVTTGQDVSAIRSDTDQLVADAQSAAATSTTQS
jgi:flagellar basal-body rod modification protein FlgD